MTWQLNNTCHRLYLGWANIFYKGPEGKYFRLCRPFSSCSNYLTLPLWCKSSHGQYLNNECVCVLIKLYKNRPVRFGSWAIVYKPWTRKKGKKKEKKTLHHRGEVCLGKEKP